MYTNDIYGQYINPMYSKKISDVLYLETNNNVDLIFFRKNNICMNDDFFNFINNNINKKTSDFRYQGIDIVKTTIEMKCGTIMNAIQRNFNYTSTRNKRNMYLCL